jgi:hypothetical protein
VLVRSLLRVLPSAQVSGTLPGHGVLLRFSREYSRFSASLFCPLCKFTSLITIISTISADQGRPESPRWLVHQGYFEEARIVVAQTNANGDLSDPVVLVIFKEIIDTLKWEKAEGRTMSPMEIVKTPAARKRFLIGMSPGPFSCIAGNIIASYYLGAELDTAGITSYNQQLKAVRLDSYAPNNY